MFEIATDIEIKGVKPEKVYDFLINLDNGKFTKWHPDHIKFEVLKEENGKPKVWYIEEMADGYKVKRKFELIEAIPNRLIRQKVLYNFPFIDSELIVALEPKDGGTLVSHRAIIRAPKIIEWLIKRRKAWSKRKSKNSCS